MTERTFVGIAINVDGSVFLNRYKIKIEEIMKICNINEIDIINKSPTTSCDEHFERLYGGELQAADLTQSVILIFGLLKGTDEQPDLQQKVRHFYDYLVGSSLDSLSLDSLSPAEVKDNTTNSSMILYMQMGECNRSLLLTLKIPTIEQYEKLNNELDDCQKQYSKILHKVDWLQEKVRQITGKDPEQIRKNITMLERDLEKIKSDAKEEQRRQDDAKEEQRRQDDAKEEQRRQSEAQTRRQQQQQQHDCPSFDKTPSTCTSKLDYRTQSRIYHPDKNKGCADDAALKFTKLANLCEAANITGGRPKYKKYTNTKKSIKCFKKNINKRHRTKTKKR